MAIIETYAPRSEALTQRQRWGHYFVLLYAAVAIFIGINLRDAALYATVPFNDPEVGISAFYPAGWLIDSGGDYVFRVRDMSQPGFKTTIQVSALSVTVDISPRNIFDSLNFVRSRTRSSFAVLGEEPVVLADDLPATRLSYTFVESEQNPFLRNAPTVIEGQDILVVESGQALVITFWSDANAYDANLPIFERFLDDLEF